MRTLTEKEVAAVGGGAPITMGQTTVDVIVNAIAGFVNVFVKTPKSTTDVKVTWPSFADLMKLFGKP